MTKKPKHRRPYWGLLEISPGMVETESCTREFTSTFADECLERAEKATKGPWTWNHKIPTSVRRILPDETYVLASTELPNEAEFIAHARTDVPELARRLERAIQYLRLVAICSKKDILNRIADELEAPPEKK